MKEFESEKSEYIEKIEDALADMAGLAFDFGWTIADKYTLPMVIKQIGIPDSSDMISEATNRTIARYSGSRWIKARIAVMVFDVILTGVSNAKLLRANGLGRDSFNDNIWLYDEFGATKAVLLSKKLIAAALDIPDSVRVLLELEDDKCNYDCVIGPKIAGYSMGYDRMSKMFENVEVQIKPHEQSPEITKKITDTYEDATLRNIYFLVKAIIARDPDAMSRDREYKTKENMAALASNKATATPIVGISLSDFFPIIDDFNGAVSDYKKRKKEEAQASSLTH